MNVFDFVILAVVIVAVGFAIRRVILDKKQGKGLLPLPCSVTRRKRYERENY